MDDDLKKWLPWIGGAAVLLIIVAVFFLTRSEGDDVAATTTVAISTTIVPSSTTSVADTTTTAPDTTTTTVATTTTVPETTTTVPPTTVPTTTLPPTTTIPEPAIGELVLLVDGVESLGDHVSFGMNDEVAVAMVTAALGPNTRDTGWVPGFSDYGACPLPEVRGVEWGSFVMLFSNGDTNFQPVGIPHFFSYYYTEPAQPDFATEAMIEIGSSVSDLEAAYGGPDFSLVESEWDPAAGFWRYMTVGGTGLSGYTNGQALSDLVTSINGGVGCGE